MGRGNWIPDTCSGKEEYDLAYIDLGLDLGEEHEDDDVEFAYNDMKEVILSALGENWREVERYERFDLGRDTSVWFSSGSHLVVIDNQGDFWHQGVAVISRENSPAFSEWWIQDIANKIWFALHESGYKLARRSCAWTCSEFVPTCPVKRKRKLNPGTVVGVPTN